MAASMKPGSVVLMLLSVFISLIKSEEFHEELFIKPFLSGHVYSHFQFTTTVDANVDDPKSFQHFRLFPKALGEVLAKYSVQELHLSLTQGLWRHQKWGYPVVDNPPGAELWVWFSENTRSVDETWPELTNVLSGMFCASLNFMDSQSTVSPRLSFRPRGVASEFYQRNSSLLRYAALPRELVCTENLTPWKKLLPCSSKAGIASLFHSKKLYDSHYQSMSLDVRPVCRDDQCLSTSVELSQSISVVLEPALTSRKSRQDWTLRSMFGKAILNHCPLAETSKVYVDTTSTVVSPFTLSPKPQETVQIKHGDSAKTYAVYDIPASIKKPADALNVQATYSRDIAYKPQELPVLYVHRYLSGYGQDKGGIVSQLHNSHPTEPLTVIYMETIPWFIRMFIHTLKIQNNGTLLTPSKFHYVPGKDRQRMFYLELVISLPPNSVTTVSFEFERAFLKWTEYPPDANHGFYVNSAVLSALIPSGQHITGPPQSSSRMAFSLTDPSSAFFVRLHTESLLVSLPTPDFSMPYNVICLACTVVAIAFGSLHNVTARSFKVSDPNERKGMVAKVKQFLGKLRGQKKVEVENESTDTGASVETEEKKSR